MESEPLLPVNNPDNSNNQDASKSSREKVAEVLESQHLHKFILTLISVDAICVLADLAYSFLHDSCNGADEEDPEWLFVFSIISLVITSLFLIEIPLMVYAFGFRFYNPLGATLHSSLHLFDAIVILVTFVLEVVLRGKERELAGLLVILRLWRLVKLVGGVAVGAGEISEETELQLVKTRNELRALKDRVKELEDENAQLRSLTN